MLDEDEEEDFDEEDLERLDDDFEKEDLELPDGLSMKRWRLGRSHGRIVATRRSAPGDREE